MLFDGKLFIMTEIDELTAYIERQFGLWIRVGIKQETGFKMDICIVPKTEC